jgi:hypothetical protein
MPAPVVRTVILGICAIILITFAPVEIYTTVIKSIENKGKAAPGTLKNEVAGKAQMQEVLCRIDG